MLNNDLIQKETQLFENKNLNEKNKKIFGFWIYLMSDCILFCVMFATYTVLINGTADGPTGKDIFKIPIVLTETVLLLSSSFIYDVALIAMYKKNITQVIYYLILTLILSTIFSVIETYEVYNLFIQGFSPNRSGFLSSFFTLVSTHGLHVIFGLIWLLVLIFQILNYGLTNTNCTRIICLSLFWHFLDIVWVCLFSFVYLIGII